MKHMRFWGRGGALLAALALGTGQAIDQVPGTQTYYSRRTDPITDVNTSFVSMYEVNDLTEQTYITFYCTNRGAPELWASLNSKNTLLSVQDANLDLMPAVTMRLGSDAPIVLASQDLSSVVDQNDNVRTTALAINSAAVRQVVNGLVGGKRLVVRVNRSSGGQALTYTFPANGFATAWRQINGCAAGTPRASAGQSTPNVLLTPAPGATAPKFNRWYFTTCRDVGSGMVRTGLVAGRAHLCDLVIETVPNGAQPVERRLPLRAGVPRGGPHRQADARQCRCLAVQRRAGHDVPHQRQQPGLHAAAERAGAGRPGVHQHQRHGQPHLQQRQHQEGIRATAGQARQLGERPWPRISHGCPRAPSCLTRPGPDRAEEKARSDTYASGPLECGGGWGTRTLLWPARTHSRGPLMEGWAAIP